MTFASAVAMVRPASFGYNKETADDNHFMNAPAEADEALHAKALIEFDGIVRLMEENGIRALVLEDDLSQIRPDAIFPNNWISCMHEKLTLFPMKAESRRTEKRSDLIEQLQIHTGISQVHDLCENEIQNIFLEGTGSMVFDHCNKVVYGCISPRTDLSLFREYAISISYRAVAFHAADGRGRAIYHTNVLMCIGAGFCVICLQAIDKNDAAEVKESLITAGLEIIEISFIQMQSFAGNMLQLRNGNNENILVMSKTAHNTLNIEQIATLKKSTRFAVADVTSIENASGGGVRCMLAELFY